jgi:hypothetical protein
VNSFLFHPDDPDVAGFEGEEDRMKEGLAVLSLTLCWSDGDDGGSVAELFRLRRPESRLHSIPPSLGSSVVNNSPLVSLKREQSRALIS